MTIKVYNTSGAPSLSVHIALREAGLSFDLASVEQPDGARKRERDYWSINPEGYLPPPLLDAARHLADRAAVARSAACSNASNEASRPARPFERLRWVATGLQKALGPSIV